MFKARIIEQPAERFKANSSLSDMLMAVEFRPAWGLGIVAMPDQDVFQTDGAM